MEVISDSVKATARFKGGFGKLGRCGTMPGSRILSRTPRAAEDDFVSLSFVFSASSSARADLQFCVQRVPSPSQIFK